MVEVCCVLCQPCFSYLLTLAISPTSSINDAVFLSKLVLHKSSADVKTTWYQLLLSSSLFLISNSPTQYLAVQDPDSYGGVALILFLFIFGRQYLNTVNKASKKTTAFSSLINQHSVLHHPSRVPVSLKPHSRPSVFKQALM